MSLEISAEIKGLVDGALASGTPMVLASVDAQGRPRLTFRGSIQVFGADALGFWARRADGSTMENIAANPFVAMMFRDPSSRAMLQFSGRARVADGAERERVYANAPEAERNADAQKAGAGVVVELDRIEGLLGFDADGKPRFVRMTREA
ncbi:MAG TPA: pyridoxamine 5'-phosphate oxidase family protein [Caulobacteraceae bacterium]|nr:pyridoxamine 5'-phosphate oxidase family protein [Caulobacteraceae bacterium]